MGLIIAMLILLLVLCFGWNLFSKNTNSKDVSCFCTAIISALLAGTLTNYNSKNYPTALDVYQGKTTLEITYRDSVPVDSVVVFKEEFKK